MQEFTCILQARSQAINRTDYIFQGGTFTAKGLGLFLVIPYPRIFQFAQNFG